MGGTKCYQRKWGESDEEIKPYSAKKNQIKILQIYKIQKGKPREKNNTFGFIIYIPIYKFKL